MEQGLSKLYPVFGHAPETNSFTILNFLEEWSPKSKSTPSPYIFTCPALNPYSFLAAMSWIAKFDLYFLMQEWNTNNIEYCITYIIVI